MSLNVVNSTLSGLKGFQNDIGTGMDIITDVALNLVETDGNEDDIKQLEEMMLDCARQDREITCFVEAVEEMTAQARLQQQAEAMLTLKNKVKEHFTQLQGSYVDADLRRHSKVVSFNKSIRNSRGRESAVAASSESDPAVDPHHQQSEDVFGGGALCHIKGPSGDHQREEDFGMEVANSTFVDFHASPAGAHCGQKKTRNAICKCFYLPGMTQEIDKLMDGSVEGVTEEAAFEDIENLDDIRSTEPIRARNPENAHRISPNSASQATAPAAADPAVCAPTTNAPLPEAAKAKADKVRNSGAKAAELRGEVAKKPDAPAPAVSADTAPLPSAPAMLPAALSTAPISPAVSAVTGSAAPAQPVGAALAPVALGAASAVHTEDDIQKYVNDAWMRKLKHAHVIMSKIGPYKLYCRDLARLMSNQELESEVIDAYLTVLVQRYNRKNVDQAAVINSYEMMQIWEKRTSKLRIEPRRFKMIVGIFNEARHWMLTVMYPQEQRCALLDSMGESQANIDRCLETTRAFMQMRGCNASTWTCRTVPHGCLTDNKSCGVFALKFAECILEGKAIFSEASTSAVNAMRLDIFITLLRETEKLENLCHDCGSEEIDDPQWIGCDNCYRWFHHGCVGRPALDEEYLCPICI